MGIGPGPSNPGGRSVSPEHTPRVEGPDCPRRVETQPSPHLIQLPSQTGVRAWPSPARPGPQCPESVRSTRFGDLAQHSLLGQTGDRRRPRPTPAGRPSPEALRSAPRVRPWNGSRPAAVGRPRGPAHAHRHPFAAASCARSSRCSEHSVALRAGSASFSELTLAPRPPAACEPVRCRLSGRASRSGPSRGPGPGHTALRVTARVAFARRTHRPATLTDGPPHPAHADSSPCRQPARGGCDAGEGALGSDHREQPFQAGRPESLPGRPQGGA